MIRSPLSIAAALLSLCLLPAAAAPAVASHGVNDGPDQIALPIGWQPEGVTTNGKKVFSGSLATGSILKANPRTGETRVLPESATGKPAVGLDFDKRRKVIWVAGGPSGEVRAQDAKTGELLATYTAPSVATGRFINDLVVTRKAVYATDSFNQELVVVPLERRNALPASGPAQLLPLTGDISFVPGEFNANGIVKTRHGLVVGQSNAGLLFRVDKATGEATTIEGVSVPGADGIEPDHRTLFPEPSIWPLLTALATTALFVGSIFTPWAVVVGAVPVFITITGWFWPSKPGEGGTRQWPLAHRTLPMPNEATAGEHP